jgi:predicted ATPase
MSQTAYKVLGRAPQPAALGWQGRRVRRVFVGREREMATLHALLAQVENGYGQVVGIAGEPGIGKSRLLYEFRQQVRNKPLTYLAGRCVSYGQATPYLPLLDLLRQACGLTESDATDGVIAKVRLSLQAVGMEPEEWGPYILNLLGLEDGTAPLDTLSPQALRARIFETLLQMQLHASRQRPLLLEVEDLHWIDPTSEEWLVALVERLAGAPLLLLLSYRAGYQPAWMGKSYATQLALQRLTADDSRCIVRAVLHARSVSDDLVQTIEAKGEGNPFFLEELAQAVAEQGDEHPTLALPETVQAVLATRLDRLPPEAKALLQVAAVVGREVSGSLLQAITALAEAPLRQRLARLQEAGFLYEARPVPELVYAFKHALTQEVAYQSLLRNMRQQYHRQIAEVLVARFAAVVETQPEALAHHYTEAGLNEQAIPYWQRAGEHAAARSAHPEAVAHLTKGLEVLQMLPETTGRARRELGLQLARGPSLIATRGPGAPEVGHARTRARELCEHVGDSVQMSEVLDGLWYFHTVRGNLQMALGLAEELLRLAQRAPDVFLHLQAHFEMGLTLFFRGELVASRSHFERAMAFYDPQQHCNQARQNGINDRVVACLSHLAWNLSVLGYPEQAVMRLREALTRAQELGQPYSQVYALIHAVTIHQHRREAQTVQEYAEAMVAVCEEQEFAHWLAAGRFYRGWALVTRGHTAEGQAQMRQGLARGSHARGPMGPYTRALWAEACAHRGQTAEGWKVLELVLAEVDHSEGCFYAAELHRLKGELLLRQAMTYAPQAEACFQQALALARRSQAKWWELRAAMSLSQLWQRQGRRDAARQLLAEVYGWFTEGFDTADLQEARVLLNAL